MNIFLTLNMSQSLNGVARFMPILKKQNMEDRLDARDDRDLTTLGNRIEKSNLTELLTTNTIYRETSNKIKILSVAPVFADVLKRIYEYESVSSLFYN